jgi:uncharacterized membrane protein
MPLTYQPFAAIPEVEQLSEELHMNMLNGERLLSGAIGFGLTASGLTRSGIARWALLLAGGALLRRAWTGHCPVYERLSVDKRHPRRGVPGNRGTRIEATVEIGCSADRLFEFWRDLEQLPRVLRHVESVQRRGGKRSHWKVPGVAGVSVEWDAEIINEQEGRFIAWQSLPGSEVDNAGSIWFEPTGEAATRVKVALEFDPPGGEIGVQVAKLFGVSAEAELESDLRRFKEFAESHLREDAPANA